MTAIDPALAYEPGVVPEPPAEPLGLTRFLRALRDNQLAVFNRESFVNDFGEARLFFSNFVLVNEPDFIEHILVTNHRNYVKGRLTRRILQPALGNGLVTSEGDFWRRQRRIMTPAFHHRHLAPAADVMVRRARPSMDGSKPAICGHLKTGHFRRPETGVEIYFTASSVGNVFAGAPAGSGPF